MISSAMLLNTRKYSEYSTMDMMMNLFNLILPLSDYGGKYIQFYNNSKFSECQELTLGGH